MQLYLFMKGLIIDIYIYIYIYLQLYLFMKGLIIDILCNFSPFLHDLEQLLQRIETIYHNH